MELVSRWLLALELTLTGCSFTLSAPAPNRPRDQIPTCDTSKGKFGAGMQAIQYGTHLEERAVRKMIDGIHYGWMGMALQLYHRLPGATGP